MDVRTSVEGDGARLEVDGDLDIAAAPVLEREVQRVLAAGHRHLTLDLAQTTLLDSAGLGALIRAAQEVHRCDGRMAVDSPPGSDARLVIQLSGTGPAIGLRDP
jgi:anti-sigma B factor antagonist